MQYTLVFERRALLMSALGCILPTALITGLTAALAAGALQLGAPYVARVLAVYAAGAVLLLPGLLACHPFGSLGPANRVTVARGAMVALLAGLLGARAAGAAAAATVVAAAALILDGVDGALARHTRMASRFGARFDMETDALFTAVLSLLAWQLGRVGAWVLMSGAARYAFVAAGRLAPRLRRALPESPARKVVAAVQMVVLVVVIAPFGTPMLRTALAAAALVALACSFARDILWLVRSAPPGGLRGTARLKVP
ncbi:MAG TPA: CDP-alcohol phosphatidyltransferase family protein [Steroidobacteraceae bacterium]|nr:CDP-alcohol phosphatidyltransferase family protein [Steroidobacteraceae bacterium]